MPQLKLENSLVDDRYEVRDRLSLGSYAEIFVAKDRQRQSEEVVIKALNTHLQGTPEADLELTLLENFQNEATALDAVRHPHIILRLGHGTAADLNGVHFHYLALEYMPGGDLLRFCRNRTGNAIDLHTGLGYFKQVCEALAYAHSKGVIHRDLKPNNFLLSRDQKILKVADFGVAKISGDDTAEITRVGADIYAPPEHHPDESKNHVGRLTASADIYSLAKSFYTVISGRTPSEFNRRPITALPANLASEPYAEALLKVLRRATADTPAERHATVIEFWHELAATAINFQSPAFEETTDDNPTRVRPKIKETLIITPQPELLPEKPQKPDFLAAPEKASSNFPSEATIPAFSKSKIVVDLTSPEKAPVIQAPPAQKKPAPINRNVEVNDSFMAPMWRRIAVAALALLFLGALIGVYQYARQHRITNASLPSITVPKPSAPKIFSGEQLEVLALDLNVRSGPGSKFDKLGAVPNGSKHKVISKDQNGWIQIEISDWSPNFEHSATQKQGWVNGDAKLVKVESRGLW